MPITPLSPNEYKVDERNMCKNHAFDIHKNSAFYQWVWGDLKKTWIFSAFGNVGWLQKNITNILIALVGYVGHGKP